MTENEIIAKGFKKLTAADMFAYLEAKGDKALIKEFMSVAYVYCKPVHVLDESGKSVLTKERISKKTGKPITPRAKVEFKPITDKKQIAALKEKGVEPRFNTLAAKNWFCDKLFPSLVPHKKEQTEKKSSSFFGKYKDLV